MIFVLIYSGFVGGEILYIVPALCLGVFYAALKIKKEWQSYLIVATAPPLFLFAYQRWLNYFFPDGSGILFVVVKMSDSVKGVILTRALSSLASVISAWLAFPKQAR